MNKHKFLSVSQAKTWRSCSMKGLLSYAKRLERKGKKESFYGVGTIFHAGIAGALLDGDYITPAKEALVKELEQCENNDERNQAEADYNQAIEMLDVYLPIMNLDEWEVVYHKGEPLIEFFFEVEVEGRSVRGFIDAVLRHKPTDQIHAIDWKTTRGISEFGFDWQAPFYASVLRMALGIDIDWYGYWIFKKGMPKPARINKDGKPSEANQDTTWEIWCATVPDYINPDKYTHLKDKMHSIDDFMFYEYYALDDDTAHAVLLNLLAYHDEITQIVMKGYSKGKHLTHDDIRNYPRAYDSTCTYCDFKRICGSLLANSKDLTIVNAIIDEDYS